MEIKDLKDLVYSEDYKERFLGEYWETKIRYKKLKNMVTKYDVKISFGIDKLGFEPTCSISLLEQQVLAMGQYLKILEMRAVIEDISLSEDSLKEKLSKPKLTKKRLVESK